MESRVIQLTQDVNRIECFSAFDLNVQEQNTAIVLAIEIIERRFNSGMSLKSANDARNFLQIKYAEFEHEIFTVIFLDQRHRVISIDELSQGTIDGAAVYPREVVKASLKHNAAAVIFGHNHPSDVVEPSKSDERITAKLKEALALVDIEVLDHFVVGKEGVVSFAERGLI
ncbi:UPF0758 family protein [hydrothermal vent metagenome]|uniref:UPF0758 family protein n=1 Tax=hydrothermal vent metagenome TaxID=652676 RepID=A0A3B0XJ47_9ZZZZ